MKIFQLFGTLIIILLLHDHAFTQPPRQNVILVIIDGARYSETLGDPSGLYISRIKQLANSGAVVSAFFNDSITVTKRAIPALWCGSWSPPRDTVVNDNATQYATVPTVWEYYRKKSSADSLGALYLLKSLTAPWLPSYHPAYGPSYWPGYILQGRNDVQVWQNARLTLRSAHPCLAVLYLADVDGAGHSGDWLTYTKAITVADSIVGALWDFIQTDSMYKNCTNIIVTNDHGRHANGISSGFTSHGDDCGGCRRIMLAGIGPGIKKKYSSAIIRAIPDIAPTIGAILNFPTPVADGSPMTELLAPVFFRIPENITFGEVAVESSVVKKITVYNCGGTPLSITSAQHLLNDVELTPPSQVVVPHDSGFIEARFSPQSPGVLNGIVVLHHNAESEHDTIHLSGSGVSGTVTRRIEIQAKWNLVSLPVRVANSSVDSLFPSALSGAFEYNGTYIPVDSLHEGKGAWLKFPANEPIAFTGTPITGDSIDLIEGWNLIGGISYPLPAESIHTSPPGILSGKLYGYSAGYSVSDTMYPGSGYWVKTNRQGVLILKRAAERQTVR